MKTNLSSYEIEVLKAVLVDVYDCVHNIDQFSDDRYVTTREDCMGYALGHIGVDLDVVLDILGIKA